MTPSPESTPDTTHATGQFSPRGGASDKESGNDMDNTVTLTATKECSKSALHELIDKIVDRQAAINDLYELVRGLKAARDNRVADLVGMAQAGDLTVADCCDIGDIFANAHISGAKAIWDAAKSEPNAIDSRTIWRELEERRLMASQWPYWTLLADRPVHGQPFVYVLLSESEGFAELQYLGRSTDLLTRLITHSREKDGLWSHWSAHSCRDVRQMKTLEAHLIDLLEPPLNKRRETAPSDGAS